MTVRKYLKREISISSFKYFQTESKKKIICLFVCLFVCSFVCLVLGTIYSVPICLGFYLTFRVKNKLYLFSSCLCLKLSCSCIFCPFSPLVSIVYCHQYLIFQFLLLSIITFYHCTLHWKRRKSVSLHQSRYFTANEFKNHNIQEKIQL